MEVTGYMLGGISLGKDLSACSVDLDIVTNYNQKKVSTMVKTGKQELPVPHTHSAQLRMFDKIRVLQQQLAGRKGGTCLDSMRGPVGMQAWEEEAHSWVEEFNIDENKDQIRSANFDFGVELMEH